jgi:putative transposase
MRNKKDLTNLTDKLCQNSDFFLTNQTRKRKHSPKEILRAIIYVNKTGCQWRMLPSEFPKWQLVYGC